ncbi:MAG: glucose-6-phosphate isomerase family protein [Candidatus Omnitrophota bacterium]|nr:glucose-6-phosphate isomerase family protein [Candidatus Omnitrophota bacterium]
MITDLVKTSGLEIQLDAAKPGLVFGKGINFSKPGVRTLDAMREVLLDKDVLEPQELYYMYRDVYRISDKALLENNKLRYDVTVIKPDFLGRELMKTAGHYHPGSYGELYEVLYGHCFCMLQKPKPNDHQVIDEVILVEAAAGEKIVIPPGFGHILINLGPEYLVTSNWVSSLFSSEYGLYKQAGGAAYFIIKAAGKLEFMRNPYFKKLPEIKLLKPAALIDKFGLAKGKPIYPMITEEAAKFAFLNRPADFDYGDVFAESVKKI